MHLPEVLVLSFRARHPEGIPVRPQAVPCQGRGLGAAAAAGQKPTLTWGTTEQAVTQRPQHPGLSG